MNQEPTNPQVNGRKRNVDLASNISPFKMAAQGYFGNEYLPVPLPFKDKHPPPKGTPNELIITSQQISKWRQRRSNIGTIVPDGIIVIDVDGDSGLDTVRTLQKERGRLPKTWKVRRGDPKRFHMWFRVPEGMTWPGGLGQGVDIIYRHYRYVMLPPSVHPSGELYQWFRPNGSEAEFGEFPALEDLPDLPDDWLELANAEEYVARHRATVDTRLWIKQYGRGDPCPEIRRTLARAQREIRKHADAGGMHGAMNNGVWGIVGDVSSGHVGGKAALRLLRETFFEQAEETGRRTPKEAEAEWQRVCVGAIEKTAIETVQEGDPCEIEEKERKRDPSRFFDKHGIRAIKLTRTVEKTGVLATGFDDRIYRFRNGIWTPDGEREIKRRTVKLLTDRYRPSHTKLVEDIVDSYEPRFSDDTADTRYLNLPNGLLEWETGQLLPFNPHIDSTIRIPVDWNEDAECPNIDGWLSEVLGADTVPFAYQIMGYCLYNDNPLHKAVLLYGSGRNGKGTFLRLAKMLMGYNNVSAVSPQALGESDFLAAELFGKLANLAGDVDSRIFKSTEKFKQITGGDYILAQRKYRDPFLFRCRALTIAAYNTLPRTADTTEGFFSRWLIVPFEKYYPYRKADTTIIDRLTTKSELEGLLVKAVAGLQTVIRQQHFDEPESVKKATAQYRQHADPVRAFISERLMWKPERGVKITRSDLYMEYVAWCARNGHPPLSNQNFVDRFKVAHVDIFQHPAHEIKIKGTRAFAALSLL